MSCSEDGTALSKYEELEASPEPVFDMQSSLGNNEYILDVQNRRINC